MSHSKKKTPIFGIASGSEKKDKRAVNRIFRKKTKTKISMGQFEKLPLYVREIIDVWSMNKDGKYYWKEGKTFNKGKAMRK